MNNWVKQFILRQLCKLTPMQREKLFLYTVYWLFQIEAAIETFRIYYINMPTDFLNEYGYWIQLAYRLELHIQRRILGRYLPWYLFSPSIILTILQTRAFYDCLLAFRIYTYLWLVVQLLTIPWRW